MEQEYGKCGCGSLKIYGSSNRFCYKTNEGGKEMKKAKIFGRRLLTFVIIFLYLITFFWIGLVLYYLSKAVKIIGHTFMLEFASAKDELKTFWKHYTNLGDI